MATIGTDRTAGTGNLPQIDQAASTLRIKPESYTTIDALIKTTKDFVLPELVEAYGDWRCERWWNF